MTSATQPVILNGGQPVTTETELNDAIEAAAGETANSGAYEIQVGGSIALTGAVTPEDVEVRLEPSWVDRVFRLDLRHFIENSGQLVLRMPTVLEATRAQADVVIVEAPPLLAVHHVEALSNMVDVVLVVGECGTTSFDEARRSGDLLRRMAAPVLGVVLTNVRLQYRDPRQLPPDNQLELTSGAGLGREPDDADVGSSGAPAHSPA